jgi:hypothetical protein
MWEEVRSLTRRARAVFRGEPVEEPEIGAHTSRPSAASLRAVAKAKVHEPPRILKTSIAPTLSSERPRKFPCVVCDAPSYAHRCSACHGYACPLHMGKDDEWCELCQKAYREEGIPQIRPAISTLLGATAGGLLAAAFFGAASAGAQRPLKLMVGPTLILMLLGMLVGVGHRWVRRWWFLRTRPNRASVRPRSVEAVIDSALKAGPEIAIKEIGASPLPGSPSAAPDVPLSLSQPHFPAPPAVPIVETSNRAASFVPAPRNQADERYTEPPRSSERPSEPALSEQASEPALAERHSEPAGAERRSEPAFEERRSEPSFGERRSDVPAHRPSLRSVPPQHWMSNAPRTPRPPSELPSELAETPDAQPSLAAREAQAARSLPAASLAAAVAALPAPAAVSVPAELTTSILALEQALSDAPAPLANGASRAPKSSRRPSRRAGRSSSTTVARVSRSPSQVPAAHAARVSGAGALAATPAPVVNAEPEQPALAPKSAVQPIAASQPPAPEKPEGWKDVLDLGGTASGW